MLTSLTSRAVTIIRGDLGLALIRTFVARGIAAVGGFTLVIVLGRTYGATGVGVYALAFSLLQTAATISRFGMNGSVMRFIGRDINSPHITAYFKRICEWTSLFSFILAFGIFMSRHLWASWFNTPELARVLIWFAVATPAFSLAFVLAGFMKAVRKPATACLLQNGIVSLITAIIVLVIHQLALVNDLCGIGIAYAIASWLVLVMGIFWSSLWFKVKYNPKERDGSQPDFRSFNVSSSSFFVSDLSRLVTQVVSIWVAGFMLPTATVGLFKAAQQISRLVSFILIVINAIFPPRFAALFHQGKKKALTKLARRGVYLGLALSIVPCLVCALAPTWVLQMVGKGFDDAGVLLQILAVAQLVNISCGSVGNLLNMAGHEILTRNVNLVFNSLCILFIVFMTPILGVLAIALGVGGNLVIKNISNVYFAWKRLGIWTIPLPNFLIYIRSSMKV